MFAGKAVKDILMLPKYVIKQLMNKLYSPLAKEVIISYQEAINHTNDLYGTNYSRIQFADDYRIAFVRQADVTAIIDVQLKSGKDLDYTRYDSVAAKNEELEEQIRLFSEKGIMPPGHNEIISLLKHEYALQVTQANENKPKTV